MPFEFSNGTIKDVVVCNESEFLWIVGLLKSQRIQILSLILLKEIETFCIHLHYGSQTLKLSKNSVNTYSNND